MGFTKSLFSGKQGAGWKAESDPRAQEKLNEQYSDVRNLQHNLNLMSQGLGPNPALDQLQQTTDQNIAQNAGFIASQKGLNPALAARMAGQNAGMMNQQAAGQAAVQTGNQQLAAMQQRGALANSTMQNLQTGISSANTANAGIQQQNAQGQYGMINGVGGAIGGLFHNGGMVNNYAHGGPVSALGMHYSGMNAYQGAVVPGQAEVQGDSLKNDTVPAMLSPKEIVLPRSVTLAEDAPKRAAEFVAKVLAQNGLRKKK